ncbi:MAG: hypothetical protein U0136_19965 [Bdellovibrionota bacterium]
MTRTFDKTSHAAAALGVDGELTESSSGYTDARFAAEQAHALGGAPSETQMIGIRGASRRSPELFVNFETLLGEAIERHQSQHISAQNVGGALLVRGVKRPKSTSA